MQYFKTILTIALSSMIFNVHASETNIDYFDITAHHVTGKVMYFFPMRNGNPLTPANNPSAWGVRTRMTNEEFRENKIKLNGIVNTYSIPYGSQKINEGINLSNQTPQSLCNQITAATLIATCLIIEAVSYNTCPIIFKKPSIDDIENQKNE